jgi:hypothetical protein
VICLRVFLSLLLDLIRGRPSLPSPWESLGLKDIFAGVLGFYLKASAAEELVN